MKDFGRSDDPRVQAQLDRLAKLSLPQGRFGLETMRALMDRLGNPHGKLPPVFHVAGTNGKGSTCAFLRAMLEANGKTVHATTSPHLVRYNERIRIAGKLIEDDHLADLLEEVLDVGEDLGPSFFEVTVAASFLAFSRTPADACVIEVGLGGRFDATNVIEKPAVCGIAALGIDHERFLLAPEEGVPQEPMARIAFEKAGIAKSGVPLVTMGEKYPPNAQAAIAEVAEQIGAPLWKFGQDWAAKLVGGDDHLVYGEGYKCYFHGPPLGLPGRYQAQNAGLAIAMLRRQDEVRVSEDALKTGAGEARWPARLQRLSCGPLTGEREVWLDGGHNRSAGEALAAHFKGQRIHLILGMLDNKDPQAILEPLTDSVANVVRVPISTHPSHPASAYGSRALEAANITQGLAKLPDDGLPVLIVGSLYLAGDILRLNDEMPE